MILGISLQTYFSIQHVQAAGYFARRAARIERRYPHSPLPPAASVAIKGYVSNTLFTTTAFLEALADELFADAERSDGGHLQTLPPATRALIANLGDNDAVDRSSVMSKFDLLLCAAGAEPMGKAEGPAQDVATMIRLRNGLVHYKAEWFDVGTPGMTRSGNFANSSLSRQIQGRFARRPGASGLEADAWLSGGCALWAVQRSVAYTDTFFERLGIPPIYDHVRATLPQ